MQSTTTCISVLMRYSTRGRYSTKKKVKNRNVALPLTHSPLSHTNDIIKSIPPDGTKLKHILRNKIFLVVVISQFPYYNVLINVRSYEEALP